MAALTSADTATDDVQEMSNEELIDMYNTINSAVQATEKSIDGILAKSASGSQDMDFSAGLSLLNLRPHLLLASMHHLLLTLALRLTTPSSPVVTEDEISAPLFQPAFSNPNRPARPALTTASSAMTALQQELIVTREVMEKVKGMEGKVSYQVGKLVGMASATDKKAVEAANRAKSAGNNGVGPNEDDEEEQDLLSFKPNAAALISASERRQPKASSSAPSTRRRESASDEDKEANELYRPPRVAAMPYVEGGKGKAGRKERRAPALLSEFASSLTSAPQLESTSGLSVRPVNTGNGAFHSNSTSANRLAELKRMDEFEEENMTRLVMKKRDSKRREEDEAALALGYGVGGGERSRSRRQGGFEAELEGVLGDRGYSKGMWDGVGKSLGKAEGVLGRSRKRSSQAMGDDTEGSGPNGRSRKAPRGKFDKAVKRSKARS